MNLIALFLLFVVNTFATTLFTTFGDATHEQIGIDGDMFDLCAKTNVEITSFDIHCYCDNAAYLVTTTEIYVATAVDQTYFDIKTSSTEWTLIHKQSINCAGLQSLTDLSRFNKNSVSIMIKDNDCRGFYVAFPSTVNGCWISNTAYASNYEGTVYVSDSAIEIKVGGGMYYPFNDPDFTRLWNGQVHYNIPTMSPTNNPTKIPTQYPIAAPTNKPTVDPTMTPSEHPTNTPTKHPTIIPTYNPTLFPTVFPTDAPTKFPVLSPTLTPTTTTGESKKNNIQTTFVKSTQGQGLKSEYIQNTDNDMITVILLVFSFMFCICIIILYTKYRKKRKDYKLMQDDYYVQLVDVNNYCTEGQNNVSSITTPSGTTPFVHNNDNASLIIGTKNDESDDDEDDVYEYAPPTNEGNANAITGGNDENNCGENENVIINKDDENNAISDKDDESCENIAHEKNTAGSFSQILNDNVMGVDLVMDDIINDMHTNK